MSFPRLTFKGNAFPSHSARALYCRGARMHHGTARLHGGGHYLYCEKARRHLAQQRRSQKSACCLRRRAECGGFHKRARTLRPDKRRRDRVRRAPGDISKPRGGRKLSRRQKESGDGGISPSADGVPPFWKGRTKTFDNGETAGGIRRVGSLCRRFRWYS